MVVVQTGLKHSASIVTVSLISPRPEVEGGD